MAANIDRASASTGDLERLSAYRPLPGVFDEMVGADGKVRAHWQPFLSQLAAMGVEEIGRRFGAADRYLRDSGVFYRIYEDSVAAERPWPLSHIPLVISTQEWSALSAGVIQRAQLLESILSDVYGPANLVRNGRLPAAIVGGNPEFLRPLVGVTPAGESHLRFCAIDVGRGADGRWWVLSDRTQAPSGAGYSLENRLAMSQALPEISRDLRVQRLAPFFQGLRTGLASLSRHEDSRVCLLTPGPLNETYFEHAYLARYLGFSLVEGEDLTVRNGSVFIRTVSGMMRTEVLLRRLDADSADPLELNSSSRLGLPGLVQAVRAGNVAVVNSLGAGFLEARALLAFMPALAHEFGTDELALSNVATWWLGDPGVRETMMAKLESMVIAPAFFGARPEFKLDNGLPGANLEPAQREKVLREVAMRGADFVMQEAVTLSTMPVWNNGALEPRPFTLRLFLAKNGDRWSVMPGGFVRIANSADVRAVSMQHGGSSTADVWVLSESPVAPTTLLPAPEHVAIKRATGALPSRAADNLFWVGRYIERAEATLRLVRALVIRFTEADPSLTPVIEHIHKMLINWGAAPDDSTHFGPLMATQSALQQTDFGGSVRYLVHAARSSASVIRDRLSPDAWRALNSLTTLVDQPLPARPSEGDMLARVDAALGIVASLSGLVQENMSQLTGWRFLKLGRCIERAIVTCRFMRRFAASGVSDLDLDALLDLCDCQMIYRQRYAIVPASAPVIDLVALDPSNPRSIMYQLDQIEAHLAALPGDNAEGRLSAPQQAVAPIAVKYRTTEAAMFDGEIVTATEDALMDLSNSIHAAYFAHNDERSVGGLEAPA